eukprot:9530365-Ditylum_brightwellii.AAC.1
MSLRQQDTCAGARIVRGVYVGTCNTALLKSYVYVVCYASPHTPPPELGRVHDQHDSSIYQKGFVRSMGGGALLRQGGPTNEIGQQWDLTENPA